MTSLLNPPYSLVCAARHVLADEVAAEPPLDDNGTYRCTQSGCVEYVFSHCLHCRQPIPGYIDGPRAEHRLNISSPRGKLGREWREDCVYCKSPHPWASQAVWANYHRKHLADAKHNTANQLPHLPEAEAAYKAAATRAKRERRARRRARAASMLDTWPKRITAAAAAVVAVLGLGWGVTNFEDLFSDAPRSTTTTTQAPATTSSVATSSTVPTTSTSGP